MENRIAADPKHARGKLDALAVEARFLSSVFDLPASSRISALSGDRDWSGTS
jgi:hypothetical protein